MLGDITKALANTIPIQYHWILFILGTIQYLILLVPNTGLPIQYLFQLFYYLLHYACNQIFSLFLSLSLSFSLSFSLIFSLSLFLSYNFSRLKSTAALRTSLRARTEQSASMPPRCATACLTAWTSRTSLAVVRIPWVAWPAYFIDNPDPWASQPVGQSAIQSVSQ